MDAFDRLGVLIKVIQALDESFKRNLVEAFLRVKRFSTNAYIEEYGGLHFVVLAYGTRIVHPSKFKDYNTYLDRFYYKHYKFWKQLHFLCNSISPNFDEAYNSSSQFDIRRAIYLALIKDTSHDNNKHREIFKAPIRG